MTSSTAFVLISSLTVAVCGCATPVDPNAGPTLAERIAALPEHGEISDGDTFTCRRIQITGTRRFERICARDSQWEDQADRTREAVSRISEADRTEAREPVFQYRPPPIRTTGPNR
tara:strand:+ start:2699 stop:3046 length:348 start_codon:yes stop_codon:yes gene_type:complete